MLLQSSNHELRDAERSPTSLALQVGVATGVGVELTPNVQRGASVVVPLDVTALQTEALTSTQLTPGREQHRDSPLIWNRLVQRFNLYGIRNVFTRVVVCVVPHRLLPRYRHIRYGWDDAVSGGLPEDHHEHDEHRTE